MSIGASASLLVAGSKANACAVRFSPAAATGKRSDPGDGAWLLNVRLALKTDDEHIVSMTYPGIRRGPKEVLDRIARGEVVNATEYYMRITPLFETSSDRYSWLNNIVSVGIGHRLRDGPIYHVFEVL